MLSVSKILFTFYHTAKMPSLSTILIFLASSFECGVLSESLGTTVSPQPQCTDNFVVGDEKGCVSFLAVGSRGLVYRIDGMVMKYYFAVNSTCDTESRSIENRATCCPASASLSCLRFPRPRTGCPASTSLVMRRSRDKS
jgi:hypothetical protein